MFCIAKQTHSNIITACMYTKTDLVFGFSKNQILVAVILGQNSFWIIAKNHFEMSIEVTAPRSILF